MSEAWIAAFVREVEGQLQWHGYRRPKHVWTASNVADVLPLMEEVEAAVEFGLHAAGYLAFEAAPAFDPNLQVHPPGDLPLAWWALFEGEPESLEGQGTVLQPNWVPLKWVPRVSRSNYGRAIERIHAAIAAGETYQVNYTFPLDANFDGDPMAWTWHLQAVQKSAHAAFIDTGPFAICSASPELFFELNGDELTTRPMKGTARRGLYPAEDIRRIEELRDSQKNRAENVMIVDMMRNDLGRISEPGTVRVDSLFDVETYPTVHQMTSTVRAQTTARPVDILKALFPPSSITGAPKQRTMELIRELEPYPRGVYTGTMGWLHPGRRASFNVAIRTATLDRQTAIVRYGTGGGIVWDSRAEEEYEECRTKALVLGAGWPAFDLLETLLWRPRSGYFLLRRHLRRLEGSAAYFGIRLDLEQVHRTLTNAVIGGSTPGRVRLTVSRDGEPRVAVTPLPDSLPRTCWHLVLDDRPTDSANVLLYHKTTHRQVYDEALERHPGAEEVLLWNEKEELTESTRANLVLRLEGEWFTPPVSCGLLGGTLRQVLVDRGRVRERTLPVACLREATEILLVNSVRGLIRVNPAVPGKLAPQGGA